MKIDKDVLTKKTQGKSKKAAGPNPAVLSRISGLLSSPKTKNVMNGIGNAAAIGYGVPLFYNMASGSPMSTAGQVATGGLGALAMMHPGARRTFQNNLRMPLLSASALDVAQQHSMGHSMLRPDQVHKAVDEERDNLIAQGIDAISGVLDNPQKLLAPQSAGVNSTSAQTVLPPFWER